MHMRNNTKHEKKNSRRKSWLIGSGFLNMFNSTPPSPEFKRQSIDRPRSQSLTPLEENLKDLKLIKNNTRPLLKGNKTSFSLFSAKSNTKKKSLPITYQESSISLGSSSRRNSSRTDESSLPPDTPLDFPSQTPLQIFKLDEDEVDRIQLKNDLVKLAFEGEFSLPFSYKDLSHGKILDVGCGPGSWCIDLALKYPQLQVIGVDSDDLFPPIYNLPKNCELLLSNVFNGLKEFPDATFDVIHIRFMALSFTMEQYRNVVDYCWRILKPGGYIEILETDLIVHSPGPITNQLNQSMIRVALNNGIDPIKQTNTLNELIPKDAMSLKMEYRSIPIGVWGGRIGVLCRDDMIHILTRFDEPESNQISVVLKEMDQYKSFSNYYFCTAQKPL